MLRVIKWSKWFYCVRINWIYQLIVYKWIASINIYAYWLRNSLSLRASLIIRRCYLQCYITLKIKLFVVLITCNLIFSSDRIDCHILACFYLRSILIEYFVWQSAVGWISRRCIILGFEHCVWECQSVYWIIEYTSQSVYWRQAIHLSNMYFVW